MRLWLYLLALAAAFGQAELADPLPVWPEDGQIAEAFRDRYVFVTRDGHFLMVRIPKDREEGLRGPVWVLRVDLHNDLAPKLSVRVSREETGVVCYRYEFYNERKAKDAIGTFNLIVPAGVYPLELVRPDRDVRLNVRDHPGAPALARHPLFATVPLGRYLGMWHHGPGMPVGPGERLGGFELYSTYEPGLTTALFSAGRGPRSDPAWPEEVRSIGSWPPQVESTALLQWSYRMHRFVVTVGPMFPPGTPAQARAARLRDQLEELLRAGHLSTSSRFVREVQKLLGQSADAPVAIKNPPLSDVERLVAEAFSWIWPRERP